MKFRLMLATACACLIGSGSILSFATALPAQAAFDLGDFDGNDSIDVEDAVSLLPFYAKKASGVAIEDLSEEQFRAADIDIDGSITVQDAVYILTYYAQQSAGADPSWSDILPEVYGIPDWQTAYYDLMLSGALADESGNATYSLIWIDQDDISELLMDSYAGGKLYTYIISIHAPTQGATNNNIVNTMISIHTPTQEATSGFYFVSSLTAVIKPAAKAFFCQSSHSSSNAGNPFGATTGASSSNFSCRSSSSNRSGCFWHSPSYRASNSVFLFSLDFCRTVCYHRFSSVLALRWVVSAGAW